MMKLKLKITVLLLLISCFFYAQNFQVLYKVTFKPSNESTEFKIEYMNLEIMKDESVFYNAKLIKPNSQEQEKDFLRFFIKQKGGSSWYYGSLNDLYFKYKEPSTKEWILSKKADTLKGYIVQEAEIFFEGRQWKAIFTKDIPIFLGPYKFSGLPGLILKIASTDGQYIFEMEVLKKNIEKPYTINNKYVEVRKSKLDLLIANFVKDPAASNFLSVNDYGDSFEYKFNGKNSESYKDMNEYVKKQISKYNNPIDKKTFILIP